MWILIWCEGSLWPKEHILAKSSSFSRHLATWPTLFHSFQTQHEILLKSCISLDFSLFSKRQCAWKYGQNLANGQFRHLAWFCSSGQTSFWPKEVLYRWFWPLANDICFARPIYTILGKKLVFSQIFKILLDINLAKAWPIEFFLAKYGQKWKQECFFGHQTNFHS